jgi:selenophosphate synthase
LTNNFWELTEEYRRLGFDPLKWVSSCSSEVDPPVLKEALAEVKRSSIKITPSWFDAYAHIEGKEPELTRRIYELAGPAVDKEVEVKRALAFFRVHNSIGESAKALGETLGNFLSAFSAKVAVSNAQVALTEHQDAQFALFDYVALHRGNKDGHMPALTAFTQVTDVSAPPDAEVHVKIAIADAVERLNLLGCGNPSLYKFFPIYDAPTDEMLDRIRANLDAATARHNLPMEDYSSLKKGKLFYGTTAIAVTNKEMPTWYDQVEEGMEVMITNKFGGLAAISLHAMAQMEPANADKVERAGVQMSSIATAREEALKSLSGPHFALGKIMAKYCPEFGSPFDKQQHVTAVYPAGTRGLFALGDLAQLANVQIGVNTIPVRDEEIAKLATKEFAVENATASQHGCHVLVGTKDVLNLVAQDLSQHHFAPEFIGAVGKKGAPSVDAKGAEQFIASKAKLSRLAPQPQPAG